ncbi:uncharacterized protein N0V89_006353 [Didymosphaeria variabile]|uniref:Uncharacterized protein n=1 Tax=Didymosphaeria variabile TaxID=1932322 RepID=A0A9W8XMQ4_9PLEO|nr:uncharacterized protein N0V89_006353 [Didymosphaeria variabile]KAJ4354616.1 hypothetical protein N0V89_006353 [Didymosphaeria variabile]
MSGADYSKLLEKRSDKLFYDDSETASVPEEASFQHERYAPSPHRSWMRRSLTVLLIIFATSYVCGSFVFLVKIYKQGEYHLHSLDPPYNHCLEAIRLSLMCAGNTALYSFQWPDSNEKVRKPKTKTNSQRTCADWDAIESWAQDRSIGLNPSLERPPVEVDHSKMDHSKTSD